jgi:processive 1,2-diacylglycerol beta-glucosyltransferase
MTSPRVLVVSGSAGHGHVKAAEAVAEAFRARHPQVDVAHLDALTKMSRWYTATYRRSYLRLVDRHPLLWRALYEATDRRPTAVGHALTVLAGRAFLDACRRWKPHAIVCTHFLAPELLDRDLRRHKLDTQLHVVVTDHDCHRAWWWPHTTRYHVSSDLVRARLSLRYGVPLDRIAVTGIPVRAQFAARHDLRAVRGRLGIDPGRPTVLFLTGGFAAGDLTRSILGLWTERRDAQVVAVCGRNVRLRRRVAALPRPSGAVLQVLGFLDAVAEVMAVADVVVTKSGGITVSEVTAMGKPLVISGSIPGQEERNADALVEAGAAVRALTPEEVRWRLARILEDPARRAAMCEASYEFGVPDAAARVADGVADCLGIGGVLPSPHFHGAF